MSEGNGYMEGFHDPIRHLKYLRQSLSQDNESIGFFYLLDALSQ
jgi:hypothetical protein